MLQGLFNAQNKSDQYIAIKPVGSSISWIILYTFTLLFTLPAFAMGQEIEKIDARKVEAAFLSNFARYISWPEDTFSDDHDPWQICILGKDPFGNILEQTLNGRNEQGRTFVISRTNDIESLPQCQIVFIAYQLRMSRRAALSKLQNRSVLTVSNAPDFLQEGGIIQFDVKDYVKFNVNLDQARAASLSIQTKVLEVSNDIIVDGKIKKIR